MAISVVMAVYNGEKFITEPIESILHQLSEFDELVISVDPSSDKTNEILNGYKDNKQVVLYQGQGKGLIENFENAIRNASNEYIFLCDQDDVWLDDKVEKVLEVFEKTNADLVIHDAKIVNERLEIIQNSFMESRKSNRSFIKNIVKNTFIGCCMAFRKDFVKTILPFPKDIPMHDQFIGLLALKTGKVSVINEPLLLYRRHGENASNEHHATIMQMIKWRISILKNVRKRRLELE